MNLNLSKKQIILIILLALVGIGTLFFFIWKNNREIMDTEIDLQGNILENTTNEDSKQESSEKEQEEIIYIMVHVTGCIKNPGLVKLKEGSRIADAIASSGGATSLADLSQINLAYILEDGQKIYIPSHEDASSTSSEYVTSDPGEKVLEESSLSTLSSKVSTPININTAPQTELETIPGIGPSTALKIISYRKENGPFKSIEDIKNVKGIGDAKFEEIKNSICVK